MDYSDMVSNYCGHEVVVAGFSEPVSLADIESVAERVNARLPTIKLVKAQQAGDTPFAPGYWVKARMEFGEGVSASDVERASGCFLGGQKFRIYSGSTCRHREVSLPFYFGGTGGSGLVVVLPAKVNPSYSLLKLWSYNKFNRLLALQVIEGVYLPAVDGVFWDVVRDCEVDFRSAGYLFVDRAEDAVEGAESALEIQGA
jgi:hypothetical protein